MSMSIRPGTPTSPAASLKRGLYDSGSQSLGSINLTQSMRASTPKPDDYPSMQTKFLLARARHEFWLDEQRAKDLDQSCEELSERLQRQSSERRNKLAEYVNVTDITGELQVTVHEGRNLAPRNGSNQKSDPYCVVRFDEGNKKREQKTDVINADLNPVWKKGEFKFGVSKGKTYRTLKIWIWDKDTFTKDDFMGSVQIPWEDITLRACGIAITDWYPLKSCTEYSTSEEIRGEIRVTLQHAKSAPQPAHASSKAITLGLEISDLNNEIRYLEQKVKVGQDERLKLNELRICTAKEDLAYFKARRDDILISKQELGREALAGLAANPCGTLLVDVVRCRGLKPASLLFNTCEAYVVLRFNDGFLNKPDWLLQEQRTPVAEKGLDPVYTKGGSFKFEVTSLSAVLIADVYHKNALVQQGSSNIFNEFLGEVRIPILELLTASIQERDYELRPAKYGLFAQNSKVTGKISLKTEHRRKFNAAEMSEFERDYIRNEIHKKVKLLDEEETFLLRKISDTEKDLELFRALRDRYDRTYMLNRQTSHMHLNTVA
eukprot:CAMPEP_0184667812 /NCGR_PEP_ID=MMETSP0308-20130426/69278_1 /TAXON_ID=38269 /ORGANISM="Gloeochaete witrockiana, Strain SAG 46.84" /LENGTH=547 /DNA_ID=CAMNT_0027113209 /DNA_START=166 /DNA_END=1809 /DNA_ORIENTATION=-